MESTHVETVTSADGTSIAYERTGSGPALILVDAALHHRAFSSFTGLIGLLEQDFAVFHYDRRGRGDSAGSPPYAVAREVEDLAALIERSGGSACVFGYSSGGLLALHAAARGAAITRLALLEPPIATEAERPAMEAAAHTLVHDSAISEEMSDELLATVAVPTLVLDSSGSASALTGMAATVAARLPNASHRSLPGPWHGVADEVLAPVLREFLAGRDQSGLALRLEAVREGLRRLTPAEALRAQQAGAYLVDTRPEYQRRVDGDVPGAIVIERNHLEWRLDPGSPSRILEATSHDVRWIVMCDEGFSSSLAAASLQATGLTQATDVVGGFQRWRAAGCPIVVNDPPAPPRLAPGDSRLR